MITALRPLLYGFLISIFSAFLISGSTLAQTGPGGVGSNDGTTTLQLWLRGDSVTTTGTTTWHDRSGYSHDFIQATGGNQPAYVATEAALGNQPAFDFDGTDDFLEDADGENYINGASAVSLIVVIKSDVINADRGIFRSRNTNNDEVLSLRYDNTGANGGSRNDPVKFGISNNQNAESQASSQTTNGQIISAQWQNSTDAEIYIDGTNNAPLADNGTSGANSPIANADFVQLGNGPQNNWEGRIAELIYFDTKLNDAQRVIIENYLNARYGISISNEYYVEASGGYVHEVVGIGYDGGASHTEANSAGFILSTYDVSLNIDGEYLMAGHNNLANATATDSLQTGVAERWARSWYVDKTTAGSLNAALTFDFGDGIPGGQYPQEANDYVLLRRNGATYDSVVVAAKIITGDQITFQVENAQLADGIYTLGTTDATTSPVEGLPGANWYSYQSGDWSNSNTWTLDPAGALLTNPDNEVPGAIDDVFILSGDAITLDIDNISVGSIRIDESVDVAATSGHNFTTITGNGRILLAGSTTTDNFPDGDVSSFADAVNGGTVEINGTGITLDQTRTWNNLVINMATATDDVVQLADITLNGNLTITRGDLQINDNSATTPLDLEVLGDVLVDTDGSMSVGTADAYTDNTGGTYGDYHQGFHEMIVHGNFTNNGGVRFTNQTEPDYNTITSSGAVSLVFTGATNNTFSCNNTTDLYNLVVDKGINQTYEVELNAATKADFALFGDNNNGWNTSGGNGANPETQKALWIKAGTLRLTGNVFIPSLSEGSRDYTIGENAALVLDGPNVVVHNTANETSTWTGFSHGAPNGVNNGGGSQGLYPLGRLQVDDGYWWLGEAEAINFRDESPGVIEVNGGELRTNQIAISSGAASGIYTFTLTGGIVRIDGTYGVDGGRAMLHLDDPNSVFTMSGGELIIEDVSGHTTNGILITSNPGNISVTGGTVRTNYEGTVEINTTAPFYDMVIETHTVDMQSDLRILNDLTIETGTTRTSGASTYGGYLDMCPGGTCADLEIGRNLTISDNAVLDLWSGNADNAGSSTITFNGSNSATLTIGDITSYEASLTGFIDPEGDTPYQDWEHPFFNLVVDKPGVTLTFATTGIAYDAGNTTDISDGAGNKNINQTNSNLIKVTDDFVLEAGTVDLDLYSIRLYGDITNKGIFGVDADPVNAQVKTRKENTANTRTVTTIDGAEFGNLRLNSGAGIIEFTSNVYVKRLLYKHGRVNIGTFNLKVDNLVYSFNDPEVVGDDFSVEDMIIMDGNASDGGLSIYVGALDNPGIAGHGTSDSQAEAVASFTDSKVYHFPIGTGTTGTYPGSKYTPVNIRLNTFNDDGYITVNVVNSQLQTTGPHPLGNDVLNRYWRIRHEGFATPPVIDRHRFHATIADIPDGANDTEMNGTSGLWRPGYVLDGGTYARTAEENASGTSRFDDANSGDQDDNNPDATNEAIRIFFFGEEDGSGSGPTPFSLIEANYTAGVAAKFVGAPQVYYTTSTGRANWNSQSKWSLTDDGTDDGSTGVPGAGDIAVLKSYGNSNQNHWVNANIDIDIAELIFDNSLGGWNPRFWVTRRTANLSLGPVSGTGTFYLEVTAGQVPNFTGSTDLGAFSQELGSEFNFKIDTDNQLVDMPSTITEYPNIRIEAGDGNNDDENRILQTTIPITVNADVRMDRSSRWRINHDVVIKDDLRITWQANRTTVEIGDEREVTLEVQDDLNLENGNGSDGARLLVKNDNLNGYEHTVRVGGDINFEANLDGTSAFNLFNGTGTNNNAILELSGDGNRNFINSSSGILTPNLYRVVMNKGTSTEATFSFDNDVNIPLPSTLAQQPVEILNGTLIINDPAINITLTDAARGNFMLPNTANPEASSGSGGLEIQQGTVRVEGDDTGIVLDGLLRVSGGTLDLDDATNNGNNFIQYSASGNAELEISDGTITVGSHIRRSTVNTSGVLKYRQTGGTVDIGTQGDNLSVFEESRGIFEVTNTGSEFTLTGGTFTIHNQNGTTPAVATLLIEPASSSVTGSTINLGGASTQTGQTIGINATIPLNNVTINSNNSPTVQMQVRDLTINGDLTINTGTVLDANGRGLLLGGDLVNDGTFTASGNTTTFNGSSDQQIRGSATTTFFNVTQSNNNTVSLSSHDITIANDLNLADGTLDDGGNTITLQRNMIHDGIHTTSAPGGGGIVFAGSSQQQITRSVSGTSTFGKLTINNSNGVRIPDNNGYNFTIDNALRLSSGVFDIGSSLMLIEADAIIEEVSPFGAANMIQTNSSFTDNGLQRNFNAIGSLTSLMFPVGQSKYTPVEFSITSSDAGSLTVRPANEMHPSVVNDSEAPDPEIVDADNVLQYHWIVKAADLTNFSATATMTYEDADAATVDYAETDYVPARLYENDTFWDKSLPTTNVDVVANTIDFPFSSVTDANITGDYTAGFPDAIPDEVPTYETTGTGDYTAASSWTAVSGPAVTDGVGPVGAIIVVQNGHTLTFNNDNIRSYRTTIESGGILEIDGTIGHSLGTVSGSGDIRVVSDGVSAVLPAGFYTDFFACSGGGLEYAGTGSYNIEGGLTELRNLTLSGSGTRTLPNNAITICNDFAINGPTFNNPNNRTITVQNDFLQSGGTFNNGSGTLSITNNLDISGGTFNAGTGTKTVNGALNLTSTGALNVGSNGTFTVRGNVTNSGTFNGGSGSAVLALGGSTAQTVTGTFTGGASFHRLEVNNASGASFAGDAEVSTELRLTNGVINNGLNTFTLAQNAVVTPTGGSSSSYLTGAITKNSISTSTSFRFPLGKGNRYSPATVSSVMTGGQNWTAEYFTTNQNDRTSFDVGSGPTALAEIANDMWTITSSGDNEATIGITWNASSGVPDPSDVRVVYWDDKASPSYTTADNDAASDRWETKGGTSYSGTASSGSVTSATPLPFSTTDISFGTATTPLPVELISFTAEMDGRVALLQWETASERNNDFFEVQRSVNGQDWTSLGVVEGNGDSDVPLSYDYKDRQPILGVSYYRLRQVDYDGRFEYSNVISLENAGNAFGLPDPEILLYPNPGQIEQVHVRVLHLKPFEKVQISLADAYGRQFMQGSISPEHLEAGYKLQSDRDLPAGMYVVSIKQGAIQLQKKLIIRKY